MLSQRISAGISKLFSHSSSNPFCDIVISSNNSSGPFSKVTNTTSFSGLVSTSVFSISDGSKYARSVNISS